MKKSKDIQVSRLIQKEDRITEPSNLLKIFMFSVEKVQEMSDSASLQCIVDWLIDRSIDPLKKDSGLGGGLKILPNSPKNGIARALWMEQASYLSICKQVFRKPSLRMQVEAARKPEHFQVDVYRTPGQPPEALACKTLAHCQRHATPPLQLGPTTAITGQITNQSMLQIEIGKRIERENSHT